VSVVDLSRVTQAAPHVHAFAAEVAESALREAIGALDLARLSEPDAPALRQAGLERMAAPLAASGLRADSVAIESVEVTATAELLSWADARVRSRQTSGR